MKKRNHLFLFCMHLLTSAIESADDRYLVDSPVQRRATNNAGARKTLSESVRGTIEAIDHAAQNFAKQLMTETTDSTAQKKEYEFLLKIKQLKAAQKQLTHMNTRSENEATKKIREQVTQEVTQLSQEVMNFHFLLPELTNILKRALKNSRKSIRDVLTYEQPFIERLSKAVERWHDQPFIDRLNEAVEHTFKKSSDKNLIKKQFGMLKKHQANLVELYMVLMEHITFAQFEQIEKEPIIASLQRIVLIIHERLTEIKKIMARNIFNKLVPKKDLITIVSTVQEAPSVRSHAFSLQKDRLITQSTEYLNMVKKLWPGLSGRTRSKEGTLVPESFQEFTEQLLSGSPAKATIQAFADADRAEKLHDLLDEGKKIFAHIQDLLKQLELFGCELTLQNELVVDDTKEMDPFSLKVKINEIFANCCAHTHSTDTKQKPSFIELLTEKAYQVRTTLHAIATLLELDEPKVPA